MGLIPREVLFKAPAISSPKFSPDGKRVAYLAPSEKGIVNIWVDDEGLHHRQMVTNAVHRDIPSFEWACDGKHFLFLSDENGDENFHLYAAAADSGVVRDLTPSPGIKLDAISLSPKRPNEILAFLNLRDSRVFDAYRINLATATMGLDTENPGDVLSWTADQNLVIRAATVFRPDDATTRVRVRDRAGAPWRDLLVVSFEDSPILGQVNGGSIVSGFSQNGKGLYVALSSHSDTTRLVELDVATGRELKTIASDSRADMWQVPAKHFKVLMHPETNEVEAAAFDYFKPEWHPADDATAADLRFLANQHRGVVDVESQDLSDRKWIVSFTADDSPKSYFLYERKSNALTPLGESQPDLKKYELATMQPLIIPARDGLQLVSYLTPPPRKEAKNLPLILLIHGGPWYRDEWQYHPMVQLLANRGYAVLQVNYRGSEGFGRKYLNAGNHQIGVGSDNDVADAVQWAVAKGIANPSRVGVMGYSFGGYAVLRALTNHPELYSCGVDVVGVSDLRTFLETLPDYWLPVKKRWVLRLGDAEHDESLNRSLSPLYRVSEIRAPLFIAHGLHDSRVSIQESEQMVTAMRKRSLPVTLVVYKDEGHFIRRPENNIDLFGRLEDFFHSYLGGERMPWKEVPGATGELR
jgi:dipeptidyl aminopeptidase/acylaminoacyl peptidase